MTAFAHCRQLDRAPCMSLPDAYIMTALLCLRTCLADNVACCRAHTPTQTSMVDYAAYFHSKIVSNSLTGLPLSSAAVANSIGLLGHSVGAGLATHVAQQAAVEGQPFKAVMYLAPQTEVRYTLRFVTVARCIGKLELLPQVSPSRDS